MNKQEFINHLKQWCEENSIDLNDVSASHGGSMLMLELIESTDDIDLTVTKEIWDKFDNGEFEKINIGLGKSRLEGDRYLIRVTDKIDIHLDEMPPLYNHHYLKNEDGIIFRNHIETLDDYAFLNRDKDNDKIKLLRNFYEANHGNILDTLKKLGIIWV